MVSYSTHVYGTRSNQSGVAGVPLLNPLEGSQYSASLKSAVKMKLPKIPQILLIFAGSFVMAQAGSAAEFRFGDQTITVPDGFIVEKVAGSPLTDRPITSDFDELGRLYVAESSGANDSVETQLKEKPHSILRLEDSDGDGFFDKRTVFADKMMFPAGTMWHDGSLYVTAPPEIWKLTDTDDDGVADKR